MIIRVGFVSLSLSAGFPEFGNLGIWKPPTGPKPPEYSVPYLLVDCAIL